jgi:hypothetical protein
MSSWITAASSAQLSEKLVLDSLALTYDNGGSVNGLDPLSGKVLWTYGNWQCAIPVPHAVDAGDGRVLITGVRLSPSGKG